MSVYNLSQAVNFFISESESDSDESDFDDSVIDPTFTDSHGGSTSEEEEGMSTDESDYDDGVDATQNQPQAVVNPANPQNASPSIVCKEVSSFSPKFAPSAERPCKITDDLTKTSSIYDIFMKIWPWSLFIQMSYYTNQRIKIFENQKKKLSKS